MALLNRVGEFFKLNPDAMRGLQAIEISAEKSGKLDAKTHELIALAVAVTTRCDGCIARHRGWPWISELLEKKSLKPWERQLLSTLAGH
ncbi:carboxymuconolactone decarboxylase family protein [Rhizobium sp. CFBP 13644]|uniref:carboxymuconolactone decarboxylase family protein n=1 Tax=Rhizobium sp. CFBP 13644 TaxID=2775307 RepID=UPI00406C574A